MNTDKLPYIPSDFLNSETGQPFSNCLICECNLMEEKQPYVIERAIRHYPAMQLKSVVFEYALCAKCMVNMENELSIETKAAVMKYFFENLNMAARPHWYPAQEGEDDVPFNISEWIDMCSVKGISRNELYEYTLCARCIGDRIIPEMVPYMISGLAQEELVALFSNKSLGLMDDFNDRYFSGPPELKALFKGRPVLI